MEVGILLWMWSYQPFEVWIYTVQMAFFWNTVEMVNYGIFLLTEMLIFVCCSCGQRRSLAFIQVGRGSKVTRLDWLRRYFQRVAISNLQQWRLNQSTCLAPFLEKKECIKWYTPPLKILTMIRWLCFLLLFVNVYQNSSGIVALSLS